METNEEENAILERKKSFFINQVLFGLRVLVVENDNTCLLLLENMLQSCGYEVTKCRQAMEALSLLREDQSKYHIILTAVHMPNMDGFKLLEIVSLEMDNLPLIMVSSDGNPNTILKAITIGCCDYLVKPVNKDSIRHLWQHVVRKRRHELRGIMERIGGTRNVKEGVSSGPPQTNLSNGIDVEEHQERKCLKKAIENDHGEPSDNHGEYRQDRETYFCDDHLSRAAKKPRLVWSAELHGIFVNAVNQIGYHNAVPKKILETMQNMGCKNLSRENIASHLQKYRMYVNRAPNNDQVSPHKSYHELEGNKCNNFNLSEPRVNGVNQNSNTPQDQSFGVRPLNTNHFHDPQAMMGSNYTMAVEWSSDMDLQPNLESANFWSSNQGRQTLEEGSGDPCFGHRMSSSQVLSNDQFHENNNIAAMDCSYISIIQNYPNSNSMYVRDFPLQNVTITEECGNVMNKNISAQSYSDYSPDECDFGSKDFALDAIIEL